MTLRELRYLVALADHRHFGHAAEACHVSQPTLSTQLKKLEDDLGVVLCERTNKAVHITPIGQQVVARARSVLAGADGIVEMTRRRTGPLTGPLVLGIIPTLSPYLLPWLIPALETAYPDLNLIVHEDLTVNLTEQLETHRIDAALAALPVDGGDLESRPLFDEPFFLACPPGHPLSTEAEVDQSTLAEENLLLLTDGHCLRDQALAVCGLGRTTKSGGSPDFRASSLETIRQMVAAGMGCTLLPALALAGDDNRKIEIRPLSGGAARRIGLVWRRNYPKVPDLQIFGDIIRETLPPSVRAV